MVVRFCWFKLEEEHISCETVLSDSRPHNDLKNDFMTITQPFNIFWNFTLVLSKIANRIGLASLFTYRSGTF